MYGTHESHDFFTHPNQESDKRQKCETRECKWEFLGWPLLWWTEYVGNLCLWPKFWEWVNSLCRRARGFFWGFWQVQLQVAKRSQKWIFLSTQRKSAMQRNWDCRSRTKLYSYIPLQHHQLQAQGHIFQKGSKISPPNLGSPTISQKGIQGILSKHQCWIFDPLKTMLRTWRGIQANYATYTPFNKIYFHKKMRVDDVFI